MFKRAYPILCLMPNWCVAFATGACLWRILSRRKKHRSKWRSMVDCTCSEKNTRVLKFIQKCDYLYKLTLILDLIVFFSEKKLTPISCSSWGGDLIMPEQVCSYLHPYFFLKFEFKTLLIVLIMIKVSLKFLISFSY
jgi:hypothetical protein